jgi:Vitamin K-dependent gamma-carboxylase
MIFGAMLLISSIRFLLLGWVQTQYIDTKTRFSYYGFEWVQPLSPLGIYSLYALLIVASVGVILGYKYQLAAWVQFLSFTYIELIDKTYYLNHYYFVSLASFILCFLPANRLFSIDVNFRKVSSFSHVPAWCVWVLKLQLGIVYFYAGLFKINTSWLLDAMPLRLWLPAHSDMPLLGYIFNFTATAYAFSWFGMLYDLSIPFLLLYRKTRPWAYLAVVGFHAITGYLFQIGVFPLVMICSTVVFFHEDFHEKIITFLTKLFSLKNSSHAELVVTISKPKYYILLVLMVFQLLFPWRYLLYPGNLFWTEEGYRFSWRVMLVEKAGSARFFVSDPKTKAKGEVVNSDFLNVTQEKQMAFQPDMILEYAHFLRTHYQKRLGYDPIITAEVYVTMNGRSPGLLVSDTIDLGKQQESLWHKSWILNQE